MTKCGKDFQAEVGKSTVINEMVKLAKPPKSSVQISKYGSSPQPPQQVRQDVRERSRNLLKNWTRQYPEISEIKEAYDTLSVEPINSWTTINKAGKIVNEKSREKKEKKRCYKSNNKQEKQESSLYYVSTCE